MKRRSYDLTDDPNNLNTVRLDLDYVEEGSTPDEEAALNAAMRERAILAVAPLALIFALGLLWAAAVL